ncbi:MAG: polyprenyl synthetase family protein [bacterium]
MTVNVAEKSRPRAAALPDAPAYDAPPCSAPLDALGALGSPAALARLGIGADAVPARLWRSALLDPAEAFLSRPGKAFRGRLVELGWALGEGEDACPDALVALVELLHAGSLIVDDIEDGSETRRGGPTLHRSHGVPLALNTGNWLYFAALSLIEGLDCPPARRGALYREAVRMLTRCHHGQALDISVHIGLLAHHEVAGVVEATTRLKTGALMGWAAGGAAIAAGAEGERAAAITAFGEALGAGLQMLDDLSGLCNPARRHKGVEDLRGARPTWPWAWLCETVDEVTFVRLQHRARDAREGGGGVERLADALARRVERPGRAAVAAQLDAAFDGLEAAVGAHPALAAARSEVDRLGRSYL